MPLEEIIAGATIATLVITNPADGDDVGQGDDHLRGLKKALQFTFPNISATVSGVAAELAFAHKGGTVSGNVVVLGTTSLSGAVNMATTLSVSGAAVLKSTLNVEGATTLSGAVTVKGALTAEGAVNFLPSGTKMLFQQTAAPTGWTKDTTHDNKALRVVSGAASSGGADAFTTVFGTGKSTDSHTLTTTEIPAHSHTGTATSAGDHQHDTTANGGSGAGQRQFAANADLTPDILTGVAGAHTHTLSINNTGGGGGHTHGISNLNLQFVDIIIATRD